METDNKTSDSKYQTPLMTFWQGVTKEGEPKFSAALPGTEDPKTGKCEWLNASLKLVQETGVLTASVYRFGEDEKPASAGRLSGKLDASGEFYAMFGEIDGKKVAGFARTVVPAAGKRAGVATNVMDVFPAYSAVDVLGQALTQLDEVPVTVSAPNMGGKPSGKPAGRR